MNTEEGGVGCVDWMMTKSWWRSGCRGVNELKLIEALKKSKARDETK
jgi:hypothetical protein